MSVHTEDMSRASLVMLEINRLRAEADIAAAEGKLDRLEAIRAEMDVLHQSMLDIRRAQLMRDLRPKPVKRRWWQRKALPDGKDLTDGA